jgi:hypothetical protein
MLTSVVVQLILLIRHSSAYIVEWREISGALQWPTCLEDIYSFLYRFGNGTILSLALPVRIERHVLQCVSLCYVDTHCFSHFTRWVIFNLTWFWKASKITLSFRSNRLTKLLRVACSFWLGLPIMCFGGCEFSTLALTDFSFNSHSRKYICNGNFITLYMNDALIGGKTLHVDLIFETRSFFVDSTFICWKDYKRSTLLITTALNSETLGFGFRRQVNSLYRFWILLSRPPRHFLFSSLA